MLADITRELRECRHELRYLRSEAPNADQQGINNSISTIAAATNLGAAKKAYYDFITQLHAYGIKIAADQDENTKAAGKKWVRDTHRSQEIAMMTKWGGAFDWLVDFSSVKTKIQYLWNLS
jgi:hypothetical protein